MAVASHSSLLGAEALALGVNSYSKVLSPGSGNSTDPDTCGSTWSLCSDDTDLQAPTSSGRLG